jgi:hypothetical protein
MRVFLSWSGETSKYVAETLSNWLEQVLQALEPWVSSDIEKGKRWDSEISEKLEHSKVAIICLTKENLDSTWIHFEAGAISKTGDAYVCTFLFDITPANVKEPLSLFQATTNTKGDIYKLLKTINNLLDAAGAKSLREGNLESVFETFWPQLQEKLTNAPSTNVNNKDVRTDRELLEETLQIVRSLKEGTRPTPLAQVATTLNEDVYELIKELWPKFALEKGTKLSDMQHIANIQEFRRFAQTHQINMPPPALRNYFARLASDLQ